MDKMVKASLDWINEIAYPDAGFIHPNDENKVKCASRALFSLGVTIDILEIKDYCIELGFPRESIQRLADWYSRPKGLRLKNGITFTNEELIDCWRQMV